MEHIPSKFLVITNEEFTEEKKLIDAETGEIILEGDYYHDHIEEQIDGFKSALDYFGYAYEWEGK